MKNLATLRSQQGVMLLEAMLGILLFSLGILAMIGLQTVSIGYVADAKYRADASFLANQIIAQIWVDQSNMANYAYPGGGAPQLTSWIANVNNDLPSAVTFPPVVTVNPATGLITVQISWQPPHATVVHSYSTAAMLSTP